MQECRCGKGPPAVGVGYLPVVQYSDIGSWQIQNEYSSLNSRVLTTTPSPTTATEARVSHGICYLIFLTRLKFNLFTYIP